MPTSLLDLPRELRDQIYDYVLISHTGYVCVVSSNTIRAKRPDKPTRISKNPTLKSSPSRISFVLLTNPLESLQWPSAGVKPKRDLTSLSIRRVCRQVHDETSGVFWNQNQFYFPDFKSSSDHGTLGVFHTLKAMGQTASRMIVSVRIDMPAMSLGYRSFAKALNVLASRARHGAFRRLELVWGGDDRQIAAKMIVAYIRYTQGGHDEEEDVKGFLALVDALRQAGEACRYERVIRFTSSSKPAKERNHSRDYELCPIVDGASEMLNVAFGGSLFWAEKLAWEDGKRILRAADVLDRIREQRAAAT